MRNFNKSEYFREQIDAMTQEYVDIYGYPFLKKDVAIWALQNGKIDVTHPSIVGIISDQFASVWSHKQRKDRQGRRVRAMITACLPNADGKMEEVWFDTQTASPLMMKTHAQDIRRNVFGILRSADLTLQSYNENDNPGEPIQMSFNFAEDIAADRLLRGVASFDASDELATEIVSAESGDWVAME